jgi:3-hydroxybutyryl-CoA dehydrogenase
MPEALRTAVVGAGTMGLRVALRCARQGLETILIARDPERARSGLAAAAAEIEDPGAAEGVEVVSDLDAVARVQVVYEAIPESLPRKQELFQEIEAFVGDEVPLVSGTSSFFPAALGFSLEFPQRVFVAHFVHPVTLVPLAEIALPAEVDPGALAVFEAWITAAGLRPLRLGTPLPGYIVNRLQFALLREALHIVEAGGATAAEVDAVMRFGLGPRWTATGPIESIALGGAATFADVARSVVPTLDARPDIPLLTAHDPRIEAAAPEPVAAGRARLKAYQAAAEVAAQRDRSESHSKR